MKKIFTLIAATVLTVATFAADRKPSVTLKTFKNYEVVIDGRSYSGNGIMQLSMLRAGQHSIKVYDAGRSARNPFGGFGGMLFKKGKRLVDASTFQVGRNDVDINIDFHGQISISEDRSDHGKWNDHGRDNDWNKHF